MSDEDPSPEPSEAPVAAPYTFREPDLSGKYSEKPSAHDALYDFCFAKFFAQRQAPGFTAQLNECHAAASFSFMRGLKGLFLRSPPMAQLYKDGGYEAAEGEEEGGEEEDDEDLDE